MKRVRRPRRRASPRACCALPAAAILTRADRDDEEYRELATRYPATVPPGRRGGRRRADRPALGAHRRAPRRAAAARPKAALAIGGRPARSRRSSSIPTGRPAARRTSRSCSCASRSRAWSRWPSTGARTRPAQAARIVGYGETGRIGATAASASRTARRARRSTRWTAWGRARWACASRGRRTPRTCRGPSRPATGGAPAYFEIGGRILVGGIASWTDDANRDGVAGNVGDWETTRACPPSRRGSTR